MSIEESASSVESTGLTPGDVRADFGEKVRKGYDPEVVDAHLERIARGVADLQARIEATGGADDESLELVLRATRRSVDEALTEARVKADRIVADAEVRAASTTSGADEQATRTVQEAEVRAATLVADAEHQAASVIGESQARAGALEREIAERKRFADDEVRERYAEIGRLLEVREVELEALDAEIERRQQSLRIASADLLRLADGFIDLRAPSPDADDTEPPDQHASSLPAPGPRPGEV